jgi:hypothetical protein
MEELCAALQITNMTYQSQHTKDDIKQVKWSDDGHLCNDADKAKLLLFGLALAKVKSSRRKKSQNVLPQCRPAVWPWVCTEAVHFGIFYLFTAFTFKYMFCVSRHFHNPRSTPSGRKVREAEENKKNNDSVDRGHYFCHAAHLQHRTGSARTSLGPKIIYIVFLKHNKGYFSILKNIH